MTRFWTISLISAVSVTTAAVISTTSFFLGKRSGIKAHASQKFFVLPDGTIEAAARIPQQEQAAAPGN